MKIDEIKTINPGSPVNQPELIPTMMRFADRIPDDDERAFLVFTVRDAGESVETQLLHVQCQSRAATRFRENGRVGLRLLESASLIFPDELFEAPTIDKSPATEDEMDRYCRREWPIAPTRANFSSQP